MVALIIIAYIIIGMVEMIPLVKDNKKKEYGIYGVIIGISAILSICLGLGVKIPSPAKPIERFILSLLNRG